MLMQKKKKLLQRYVNLLQNPECNNTARDVDTQTCKTYTPHRQIARCQRSRIRLRFPRSRSQADHAGPDP